MSTKTIPEYLEDERRSREETLLRTDEEAARIQSLHPGHHRTRKLAELESPVPLEAAVKARKPAVAKVRGPAAAKARRSVGGKAKKPPMSKARKTVAAKTTKPSGAARRKPPAARKKGTKVRKRA
jgi:hypothetical protein